jgi:hypothetical protein
MRAILFRRIISFCLATLLIFKGAVFLSTVYISHSDIQISELLMETEQEEKKGGNKAAETSMDELFDKAVLSSSEFFVIIRSSTEIQGAAESLQDVYLDELTPPPNA